MKSLDDGECAECENRYKLEYYWTQKEVEERRYVDQLYFDEGREKLLNGQIDVSIILFT